MLAISSLSAPTRKQMFLFTFSTVAITTLVLIPWETVRNSFAVANHPNLPRACRRLARNNDEQLLRQLCRPHFDANSTPSNATLWLHTLLTRPVAKPTDYVDCVDSLSNCNHFRSGLGYIDDVTPIELDFPLAFSLLTYENFDQTERLLRLIYRPHNVYCLHVDAKSPPEMHLAAEAVASCLGNVFVARPPVEVRWGTVSVVEAEMTCIKLLLERDGNWKYFINLVGRDFPLRTNHQLVEILSTYDGANDVDGSRRIKFYPDWFKFSWLSSLSVHGQPKTDPPHGFNITKGSAHFAATRSFVDFALNDRKAKDLLNWMKDTRIPDELFFQTLNHNPHLSIPGSFKGDPDAKQSLVRLKHWSTNPSDSCSGTFVREVCNIGLGDLPWVTASRHMFVNKIREESEPLAFRCLEQWYLDRVGRSENLHRSEDDAGFNISIYAQQAFVTHHV